MAIETQHLALSIGKVIIANDLNAQFVPGDCWALIGRNGVGKSTLLHVLGGLRGVDRGQVLLDGNSINAWSHRQRAQRIGVLLQDSHDLFPMTVREAVASGRHPYSQRLGGLQPDDVAAIEHALVAMDLHDLQDRSLPTLSGGERRRVAIAALIAQQATYLLLDEPVNHLDLHYQIKVLEWIQQRVRQQQKTAVVVMHDLNLAWRYCNKAILLYGDGEVECGEIADLLDETRLRRLYAHPIARVEAQGEVMFVPKGTF